MRRGINDRKKKRIILKKININFLKLITLLIIILLVCLFIYFFFVQNSLTIRQFEKENINIANLNRKIPFSINKIILFSSVNADTNTVNQSALSLDLSQFCDIGIYLNKVNDENISISSLYIDNIYISPTELGTPCLYKKMIPDLGKCSFDENNIINNRFDFNIVSNGEELTYDNYELYDDCSIPISLGFYNKNIKNNFILENSEISYNGSLLKDATIPLSTLECNVSFQINVITTSKEHYICNVSFNIPFEDENGSIYNNGYTIKEYNTNETSRFIRLK